MPAGVFTLAWLGASSFSSVRLLSRGNWVSRSFASVGPSWKATVVPTRPKIASVSSGLSWAKYRCERVRLTLFVPMSLSAEMSISLPKRSARVEVDVKGRTLLFCSVERSEIEFGKKHRRHKGCAIDAEVSDWQKDNQDFRGFHDVLDAGVAFK